MPDIRFTADMADTLLSRLSDTPLAIHPAYLRRMRAVLDGVETRESLTAQIKQRTPRFQSTKGVAVIPVVGPIFHRADPVMEFFFGATSTEQISANVKAALEDDDIEGILFDVDSPGGEVAGVADLCDLIYAGRSQKPMLAVADEEMYSAAYWIASAAHQIVLPRTAGVGSIGVLAIHVEQSKLLENMGVTVTVITSGDKKDQFSSFKPLSDEARAELQTEVDRLARIFEAAVARNRGLSPKAVRALEAGTVHGEPAVTEGLADTVLVADEALDALQIQINERRRPKNKAAADEEDVMKDEGTQPAVAAAPVAPSPPAEPAQTTTNVVSINKAREEGHRDGAAAAKAEAQSIALSCQLNHRPELAAKFIGEGKSHAEVVSTLLAMDAEQDEASAVSGRHAETGGAPIGTNVGLLEMTKVAAAASAGGRK